MVDCVKPPYHIIDALASSRSGHIRQLSPDKSANKSRHQKTALWSPEDIDKLVRLCEKDGLSLSAITKQLAPLSRHHVSKMICHLKLRVASTQFVWSPEKVAELWRLRARDGASVKNIARHLNINNPNTVRSKIAQLRIPLNRKRRWARSLPDPMISPVVRAGSFWTAEKVSELRRLWVDEGARASDIAKQLGASDARSIYAKIEHMKTSSIKLESKPETFWTNEREVELRRLWVDENMSATEIAIHMGIPSRNAIMGKVHRLKLTRKRVTSSNVSL